MSHVAATSVTVCWCCCCCAVQLLEQREADQLESVLGWPLFTEGDDRLGWLMNFTTVRYLLFIL